MSACSCFTLLGGSARSKPLSRCYPLSFLYGVVLPDIKVCVQFRGPILTTSGLRGIGPIFLFYLQECFHLFDYCRVGPEPCAPQGYILLVELFYPFKRCAFPA